jgi:heme exporter protein B
VSWRRELHRARAVAIKDLTAEWRTRANFNAVTFFGALMLLLFGFALGPDTETLRRAAPGVIWLTVLFSGVLAFNRSYQIELDNDALETLLAYPGDRRTIFLGKLAANLTFVLLVELIIVPLTAILYGLSLARPLPGLAGVLLLGTFGFVTLGTFYSALSSRSRAREVLLPLLLFPMLVPVLIAAAQATTALLAGDPMGDARTWASVLAAFDVIFFVASLYAFEHVIGA